MTHYETQSAATIWRKYHFADEVEFLQHNRNAQRHEVCLGVQAIHNQDYQSPVYYPVDRPMADGLLIVDVPDIYSSWPDLALPLLKQIAWSFNDRSEIYPSDNIPRLNIVSPNKNTWMGRFRHGLTQPADHILPQLCDLVYWKQGREFDYYRDAPHFLILHDLSAILADQCRTQSQQELLRYLLDTGSTAGVIPFVSYITHGWDTDGMAIDLLNGRPLTSVTADTYGLYQLSNGIEFYTPEIR